MAVAIFSFLPYCQMVRGNVIVDVFTTRASPRTRALLDSIGNLLFTAIAALLTWRAASAASRSAAITRRRWCSRSRGVVGLRSGGRLPRLPHGRVRPHGLAQRAGIPRRAGGCASMSGFAIGLLSFPIMLALICLRVPIGARHAGWSASAVTRLLMSGPSPLITCQLKPWPTALLELRALGRAAVPADGPVRTPAACRRAVPRRRNLARPSQRRHRHGDDRRLRRLRRDLRLVARDRRDHGPGGAARAAPQRLFGRARDRHARGRRHARHPDPALDHPRDLRDPDRAEHRQAVRRRRSCPGILAALGYAPRSASTCASTRTRAAACGAAWPSGCERCWRSGRSSSSSCW